MKTILTIGLLVFGIAPIYALQVAAGALHEDDRELYDKFFEQAAEEFRVPADILRGLSFSETRWTHMVWADGDTASSCNGMPRVYGVMGLWDNPYFGYSLREAASLIRKDPSELKQSPLQNIRGAAALLRKYYEEQPAPEGFDENSLEHWQNAIAKFSGIPQEELAHRRGLEIYSILSTGYARDRILIPQRPIRMEEIRTYVREYEAKAERRKKADGVDNAANQPDYPLAKWNPARNGHWSTTLIQQKFVVIHDVEGSYLGCISWFQNPNNTYLTSAHYILNSHPNGVNATTKAPNNTPDAPVGEITQMVEERYRAHHVGCWNSYMIGIEHEGYAAVNGWYTPECYDASSKLVKYLCDKYNIPKDRNHVIAHGEHQNSVWRSWVTSTGQGFDPTCNTHTDPGPFWTWTNFMSLVSAADTVRPVITNALASSNTSAFPTYKDIVIDFNTPMDVTSTNAAFSIQPTVVGTKIWSADNKKLTFDPTSFLPWSTAFTVTIDTSAKNVAKSRNLGTVPFVTSFTTMSVDTVGPIVMKSYPAENETNVSGHTDVVLYMNEPVLTSSLSTTMKFVDENEATVSIAGAKNETVMDRGVISFTPLNLKPGKTYTIKLLAGVKDPFSNVSSTDVIRKFTVSPESVTAGTVLDNLDANTKGWLQPYQSVLTAKVDSAKTSWSFVTEKVKAGAGSALLSYAFSSGSGGIIEVKATGFPPVDFYTSIGVWINGDMSNSSVEFRFAPNDQIWNVGKIYWRGWKFVHVPIATITGANKILKSIVIRQDSGFTDPGKLYFDEFQLNAVVTGNRSSEQWTINNYSLEQNYPNPFNPSTEIRFFVPVAGHISLRVHDLLGREIAVLRDDIVTAGAQTVTFDASELPSGVYYYTMRSGAFRETRKMMLIK